MVLPAFSIFKKRRSLWERRFPESSSPYPGPAPRSKETALVMLADSVEAAITGGYQESLPYYGVGGYHPRSDGEQDERKTVGGCGFHLSGAGAYQKILCGSVAFHVSFPGDPQKRRSLCCAGKGESLGTNDKYPSGHGGERETPGTSGALREAGRRRSRTLFPDNFGGGGSFCSSEGACGGGGHNLSQSSGDGPPSTESIGKRKDLRISFPSRSGISMLPMRFPFLPKKGGSVFPWAIW